MFEDRKILGIRGLPYFGGVFVKRRAEFVFFAYYFTSLLIGLMFLNSSPSKWDSAEFLRAIVLMNEGKVYSIALGLFPGALQYGHPLYFVLGVVFYRILSPLQFDVELTTLLMSIILGGFIPILVHKIVYNLYSDEKLSLFAGLLALFNPLMLWYSNEIMTDIPCLFFIMLSFFLATKFLAKGSRTLLFAASMSLCLAVLVRFTALFVFPAFLFLALMKKRSSLGDKACDAAIPLLSLILPAAYVVFYYLHFNYDLGEFFLVTGDVKFSFVNFGVESMVVSFGFLINSFTSFFVFMLSAGVLTLLFMVCRKKITLTWEFYVRMGFPFLWLIFFIAYSMFLPAQILLSRHNLIITPAFILLFIGLIDYLEVLLEKRIIFHTLAVVASLLIVSDLTILFNLPFPRYYTILAYASENIINFTLQAIAVFIILHAINHTLSNKLGKRNRIPDQNAAFLILVISLSSLIYTIPVLHLNHTKINHEKAEAVWFAENTEPDALIIAGHELPFDHFYARPRSIVFVKKGNYSYVKERVNMFLDDNKPVYFSENDYLLSSRLYNDKDFRLVEVGVIPGDILRNQFEHKFAHMDYYLMSKSKDIHFFRVEEY